MPHRKPWLPSLPSYRGLVVPMLKWIGQGSLKMLLLHFSEDMIYPKGCPFTCLVYTNISGNSHLADLISALRYS